MVVDPFGGSGTTYAVAEAFNRKWLGNDKSYDYCNVIKRRLMDKSHIAKIANINNEKEIIERRKRLRG